MLDFFRRREEHRAALVHFLASNQPLAMLVDNAGNIGDSLIREGTRQLFTDAGLAYSEVHPDLHSGKMSPETLVVRGCGGYDRHFHKFMPDIVLRASSLYRSVIVLPSSFDPRQPEVAQCLGQRNVYAVAREMQSYEKLAPFGRRHAWMDCAVYHRRFRAAPSCDARTGSAEKMLLVLRQDKGSPLPAHGLEPERSLNEDISVTSRNVEEWLDRIATYETVVTDRLHVALAASLMGKRLVMIDPYDKKLSEYMAFVFGDELASRVELQDVAWLTAKGFAVPVSE
jgi:exopolysaccharide biosynthesis predicted pyruvyltransferase EpsI